MYRSLKMLKSCFGGYAIWRSCGARELRCGGIAGFIKLSVLRRLLGKIRVMTNNKVGYMSGLGWIIPVTARLKVIFPLISM